MTRASFTLPRLPATEPGAPDAAAAAQALGLTAEDMAPGEAPVIASAGVPFVIVPVRGLDAAARARPDPVLAPATFGDRGIYVVTDETRDPEAQIHARMFSLRFGIAEDAATGSAAAALMGVLAESLDEGDHTVVIEQGLEMGRPSRITLGSASKAAC